MSQMNDGDQGTMESGADAGLSINDAAGQISGLLDAEGHVNPGGGKSRAHPDNLGQEGDDGAAESARSKLKRNAKGQFTRGEDPAQGDYIEQPDDEELEAAAPDGDADDDIEDDDKQQDDAPDSDEADSDEDAVKSVAELAAVLEIPVEELMESLTHTFRAADQDFTVTLKELEKGYQRDADYRRSTQKLADDRRAMETAVTERVTAVDRSAHAMAAQVQVAMNLIAQDINSPAMQSLRNTDPAEWTARQNELNQRLGVLNNIRAQAAAMYDNLRYQNLNNLKTQGLKDLQESIPDFGKEHVEQATGVMQTLGFSPAEISQVLDPRVVKAALELHTLRKEKAEFAERLKKAEQATKRVKQEVTTTLKPGTKVTPQARKGPQGVKRGNVQKLSQKFHKSKHVRDAAKLLEQML